MTTRQIIVRLLAAATASLAIAPLGAEEAPTPVGSSPKAAAASEPAPAQKSGSSFVETFTILSDLRWYVSDGWTNGDHQGCTWSRKHVRIPDPGKLQLAFSSVAYKDRGFSCAEIQTKARYGYGTYEVRMKPTSASGLVTAFFTYSEPNNGDVQTNNEIDFEFLGKDTNKVQLNYFVSGVGQHESMEDLGFDASTTMADYAIEWLPDALRWYANGRLIREVVASEGNPIPSHPSKIMISIWSARGESSEAWLGPVREPGEPLSAAFETVAFTKLGDSCKFKESLLCRKQTSNQNAPTIAERSSE